MQFSASTRNAWFISSVIDDRLSPSFSKHLSIKFAKLSRDSFSGISEGSLLIMASRIELSSPTSVKGILPDASSYAMHPSAHMSFFALGSASTRSYVISGVIQ